MSLEALESLSKDMTEVSLGIKTLDHHLAQASSGIAQLAALQEGLLLTLSSALCVCSLTLSDQYLSSVHDWLSPLFHDFAIKHHETLNTTARQDGLGRWLLGLAEYQQWLSGEGETIWCLGPRKSSSSHSFLRVLVLSVLVLYSRDCSGKLHCKDKYLL